MSNNTEHSRVEYLEDEDKLPSTNVPEKINTVLKTIIKEELREG